MTPLKYIEEWRQDTPMSNSVQVEQDSVIGKQTISPFFLNNLDEKWLIANLNRI